MPTWTGMVVPMEAARSSQASNVLEIELQSALDDWLGVGGAIDYNEDMERRGLEGLEWGSKNFVLNMFNLS